MILSLSAGDVRDLKKLCQGPRTAYTFIFDYFHPHKPLFRKDLGEPPRKGRDSGPRPADGFKRISSRQRLRQRDMIKGIMDRRDPELAEKVRRLYEGGASTREMGRALGFSFATARNILIESGIPRRKPGRPPFAGRGLAEAIEEKKLSAGFSPAGSIG